MTDVTLGLIKPDAVQRQHIGAILAQCEAAGLTVRALTMTTLSQTDAERFYTEHRGKAFFPRLTTFMSSGPLVAMVLSGPGAIQRYRALMGATDPTAAAPDTLRARFGTAGERNAVHGSDSPTAAAREIAFFFPDFPLTTEHRR